MVRLTHENKWDYWAEVIDMFYDENNGTYRIKVKPGDYVLSVGGDSGGTHYKPQFYDGKYDPKKATKITVAEDETKTINFKLYPELDIRPDYFDQNPNVQQINYLEPLLMKKITIVVHHQKQ